MLGFDDHPGQLYRLWHVMNYGPAPWAWDRGWWAGYPELQFYPPGFAYLGALLAWATTGVLDVGTVYQALLWLAYLLPGVTTYVVLARLTGLRWLALAGAFGALLLAAALTAFWTLPLLLRLAETRALAWGTLSLGEVARPLPIVLAALAVAGLLDRTPAGAGERLALWWLPAMVVATALDRLAAEPLGIRWLPADRIVDGAWIALVVAGGVGAARLTRRLDAMPIMQRLGVSPRSPAFGLGAAALFALLSLGSDTLMLRPGAGVWPSLSSIERGLRLPDFWSLLGRLPEGRLLFVRSGVPLVYGGNWWRPHTHVTALTPVGGGRDIVHGTFTHPSPPAAPLYRGDAGPGALTQLPEPLDRPTRFGA